MNYLIFLDVETLPNLVVTEAQVHTSITQPERENLNLVIDSQDAQLEAPPGNRQGLVSDLTVTEPVEENQNSLLNLFGVDPQEKTNKNGVLLDGIATRWAHLITKGLDEEERQRLVDLYPPASNCSVLVPPILNEEIAVALKDNKIREDKFLQKLQMEISSGLMALYAPISSLVQENQPPTATLENLANSAKIFSDCFHQISRHRRFLLGPSLNPQFKKCLESQEIDKFLYGENLTEKVKQYQATKTTLSQVVAVIKPKKNFPQNNLNYSGQINKSRYKPEVKQYRQSAPAPQHQNWRQDRGADTSRRVREGSKVFKRQSYHRRKNQR